MEISNVGDETKRTQPFCLSVTTSMTQMWDYIENSLNSRKEIPSSVQQLACLSGIIPPVPFQDCAE